MVQKISLPPLTRAGIAHIYFVSIHPFEDGNGRIGRAIVEKSLSQHIGHPTPIALSATINEKNLNPRQLKAVKRIFKEGLKGFQGGVSAKNYKSVSKTSDATVTRDLQDLVNKGVFSKTGQFKSTRYFLKF